MTSVVEFPKLKLVEADEVTTEVNQDLVEMFESLLGEAKRGEIHAAAVTTVTNADCVEHQFCHSDRPAGSMHEMISGVSLLLRRLQDVVDSAMVEVEIEGN